MTSTIAADALDLTLARDPAAIWPDALDCPDFPLQRHGSLHKDAWSRADAEARLRTLARRLNGAGALRAPSDDERTDIIARYFHPRNPAIRSINDGEFDARGFPGLTAATGNDHAFRIAEAVHLRGYLRKLDVQAEIAETRARDGAERRARHTLESYKAAMERMEAEATALADGAMRYRQWLEDQAAFERLRTMPADLVSLHRGAVAAAEELGEAPPEEPQWIKAIGAGD